MPGKVIVVSRFSWGCWAKGRWQKFVLTASWEWTSLSIRSAMCKTTRLKSSGKTRILQQHHLRQYNIYVALFDSRGQCKSSRENVTSTKCTVLSKFGCLLLSLKLWLIRISWMSVRWLPVCACGTAGTWVFTVRWWVGLRRVPTIIRAWSSVRKAVPRDSTRGMWSWSMVSGIL